MKLRPPNPTWLLPAITLLLCISLGCKPASPPSAPATDKNSTNKPIVFEPGNEDLKVKPTTAQGPTTGAAGTGNAGSDSTTKPENKLGMRLFYSEAGPPEKKDCMDVPSFSTLTGAAIMVYPCKTTDNGNQLFNVEYVDANYFVIKSKSSALCLTIEGAVDTFGGVIVQADCTSSPAPTTEFMVMPSSTPEKFKLQLRNGKCLKIEPSGGLSQNDCTAIFSLFSWEHTS